MAINPVSFRADSSVFNDLVNRKQAYAAQPAAASGINNGNKAEKSHKGVKVAAGLAGIAAIALGTLAVVSKNPELVQKIKNSDFLQKHENLMKKAVSLKHFGENIADKATGLFKTITSPKASETLQNAGEETVNATEGALDKATAAIEGALDKAAGAAEGAV